MYLLSILIKNDLKLSGTREISLIENDGIMTKEKRKVFVFQTLQD